jgi:hypothetical protein
LPWKKYRGEAKNLSIKIPLPAKFRESESNSNAEELNRCHTIYFHRESGYHSIPRISLFSYSARGSVHVGIPPGISCFSLKITDMAGKTVMIKEVKEFRGGANYELNIGALSLVLIC